MAHKNNINKNLVLQHFHNQLIPTNIHFQNLIRGLVNTKSTGSKGADGGETAITGSIPNNMLKGMLSLSSGSTDYFHQIAPPFVPNLHPYIKVFNFDNYTQMASGSLKPAIEEHLDFIWDCTRAGNSNAGTGNVFNLISSGSISSSYGNNNDFLIGHTTLKSGPGSYVSLGTSVAPFKCEKNYPWWIKTRFRTKDGETSITQNRFFFGLTECSRRRPIEDVILTSEPTNDRVGFVKKFNTNSAIQFAVTKNDGGLTASADFTTQISSAIAPTHSYNGSLVHNMGIFWDGHADPPALKYYYSRYRSSTTQQPQPMELVHTFTSGSVSGVTSGAVPDDSFMRLVFYLETTESTIKQLEIESINGAFHTKEI